MSGEFGEFHSGGYFHDKVRAAAEDCLDGGRRDNNDLTRLWGEFLEIMVPLARDISWFEACDSGYDAPVLGTLGAVPKLRTKLDEIAQVVDRYKQVADAAVRAAIRNGA
jgi:hypothetical protein